MDCYTLFSFTNVRVGENRPAVRYGLAGVVLPRLPTSQSTGLGSVKGKCRGPAPSAKGSLVMRTGP